MATRIDVSQLADGGTMRVDVDGAAVLVCRVRGELFAVADECSHARQSLSGGRLRGYHITCPLHGARFDVRDGGCLSPPATQPIASYDVAVSADGASADIGPR